jgi:ketosteroid isomerase-like protein
MIAQSRAALQLGLPAGSVFRAADSPRQTCRRLPSLLVVGVLFLMPALVSAQEKNASAVSESSIEEELAEVRAGLVKAFNTRDLELLLSYCRSDVIATWPNGQVAVGHDQVREVIDELLGSDQPLIESYTTDPVVETRIVLHDGQTVVSRGKFNDEYTLSQPKGRKVRLDSNWTTTLVKIDGRWQIASFHMSANAFDNEVITLYAMVLRFWWGGMGLSAGLVLGGVLGFAFGRRRRRKQTAPAPGSEI